MKFKFNINDYVTVTLTEEGALHLNKYWNDFYEQYPQIKSKRKHKNYAGEVYRTQFWSLIQAFEGTLNLGCAAPFEYGEISVDTNWKQDEVL